MRCQRCLTGLIVEDPPRWQGDAASAKCVNCGDRKWFDPVTVKPGIPPIIEKKQGVSERSKRRHNKLLAEQEYIKEQEAKSGKRHG